MNPFVECHHNEIAGVLSCFDRVIITGTLPEIAYAEAMARYLSAREMRLFDYTHWAEPLRDELCRHTEALAEEAGLQIEFIRPHKAFRKEQSVKAILTERGDHPGLVHIFSAKCLHYYFYFIDELFGLCYLRVPTWAPFRLQAYFNGHHWLARRLAKANIDFEMTDNAFVHIANPHKAQLLANSLDAKQWHRRLDRWAQRFCPLVGNFQGGYHWSFMQVEYATDVIFHRQTQFQPLYDAITRTAVQAVKAEHLATFLGRKLTSGYRDELGNDFSTCIQGTRIRHHMGAASIKLYDKLGIMARVECTANDVAFFKHHRWVEQRDGNRVFKLAPLVMGQG